MTVDSGCGLRGRSCAAAEAVVTGHEVGTERRCRRRGNAVAPRRVAGSDGGRPREATSMAASARVRGRAAPVALPLGIAFEMPTARRRAQR